MRLKIIHFPLISCPHGATGAVKQSVRACADASRLEEFRHTGVEGASQGAVLVASCRNRLLQYRQVAARPEVVLEALCLFRSPFEGGALAENVCPGQDGDTHQ